MLASTDPMHGLSLDPAVVRTSNDRHNDLFETVIIRQTNLSSFSITTSHASISLGMKSYPASPCEPIGTQPSLFLNSGQTDRHINSYTFNMKR